MSENQKSIPEEELDQNFVLSTSKDEQEQDQQKVKRVNIKQIYHNGENPRWYVIHTYSGYENKVKDNIEKIIENRNMYDVITDVIVPVQEVLEINKAGQKKLVTRKVFPGYVFVKMIMNDDTWFVVRNTRGVTSFVGPGSKPVALTEAEVISMGIESFSTTCNISEGDIVLIKEGPFANSSGIVKEVNVKRKTISVNVNFFGRETPVELNFEQVQQMT